MADAERERVGYFRQRWANENFRSQQSITPADRQTDRDIHLSELNAQDPVSPDPHSSQPQKRSWRDSLNFRLSPINRLAPARAPTLASLSHASTSLRSPVDSQNNTIYSNIESPASEREQVKAEAPKQIGDAPETLDWLNELYVLSWLTLFALLGTLARLGVEAITEYPDAPVTSRVLWANLGGSFIMGLLVEDRMLFGVPEQHPTSVMNGEQPDEAAISAMHLKHKKTIPLFIGLATGFCGSFTSFSSFIRDAFLALTNDLDSPSLTAPYQAQDNSPTSRNGGFSFLALAAILILHPAVSLAALKVGGHFGLLVRFFTKTSRPIFNPQLTAKILNPIFVVVGLGCWLFGSLFITIFPPSSGPSPANWRARATIPLLFAPPGCILRYYLAKHLNRPTVAHFPWGTFIANVFGSFVLAMAWDLQHARGIGAVAGVGSANSCAVLLGVQEGFCGCLTTVSTWVVELNGMGRRWGWAYGGSSVIIALAGVVIIMGGMGWTIGFSPPVCG